MQSLRHASTLSSAKVPHIAVIGAGIAGLRCSDVLARSGCKVTLLEARNRIGGRVHQVETGGHLVDMGPNWIHGTKGNPIMGLAEKTGTKVLDPEEDGALYDASGKRRTDAEAVQLSGKIWDMVVDAFKYSDEHSATIDSRVSLYEYFQEKLSKVGTDERHRDDLLHEAQMWGPFVGDPVEKQSLKFFFLEECIEGENVFVASTYKNILNHIGKTVTETDKVDLHLNTEVVHFDTTATNGVTVTTSTGQKSTFDQVVVTCPLGWLKRNHSASFTPPLPTRISEAIQHINYGRLEKLYVTFRSAFWLRDANNSKDKKNFPVFTHFHDPSYIDHPKTEAWNQSVVSLAHLPSPCAHPTLLFYIYGPCATYAVNLVKDLDPHTDRYNAVLRAFAEPFYSRLPTYSSSDPACTPTSFLMTQWQNDRFAGNGSYCNFQVGLERGDEDIQAMRAADGLTERGIWLAGEHTAPFIALGTTTGAWWSGEGVARRICNAYGIDVPEDVDVSVPDDGDEVGVKKDLDGKKADAANMNGLAI
ncbi:hypothetical protein PV11_06013 [Exophiala sideris]|uniref:Amine oxidase domain-containing protein n=1 Tax=Exophiala sideris TaxID=1016849 RepID=A0A0D1ZBC9_9EURO|nr:hypothetical protein PV11_06013 [Exophiala sideris]